MLYDAGYLIAMIRTSMVEVMRQPFIRTAVLKGMSFRGVVVKHALRNALIAPFTVILLQLNYLVAGLVVVEMVFAYPGFGRMMLEAALAKDIAVVEAGTLVAVFVTMLTQIVGDLGYRALDPRIRYDARPARPCPTDLPSTPRNRGSAPTLRGTLTRVWAVLTASPVASLGGCDPACSGRCCAVLAPVDRALPAEPARPDGAGRPVPVRRALAGHRPARPRHPLAHPVGRAHRADRRARSR